MVFTTTVCFPITAMSSSALATERVVLFVGEFACVKPTSSLSLHQGTQIHSEAVDSVNKK